MILGLLIVAVVVGSVTRTGVVQELMAGAALISVPLALAEGDWGLAVFAMLILAVFAWRWGRVA